MKGVMSYRRWLSHNESLLVITAEEDSFLTGHGIDQHDVFDGTGMTVDEWCRHMKQDGHSRVAIGVAPCEEGHAMRDGDGLCVMCHPVSLDPLPVTPPSMFTNEEIEFLRHHDIELGQVYFARGQPRRVYGPVMKTHGYIAATQVTRCLRGHALRNRRGACLICNPASMKFLERHHAGGWVYLAYSAAGRLYKVGTSNDLDDRFEQLNIHRYGGQDDWVAIERAWCDEAGRAEHAVQAQLASHAVEGDYGGRPEYCRELFRCNRRLALAAFRQGTTD